MINISYKDIITPQLLQGAIENNEMHGFRQDFHILHCLIKIHQPKTFLEIGTNVGRGISIISNAGQSFNIKCYSLDLPPELSHYSLQYPGNSIGSLCKLPFIQLLANSLEFDYSSIYPMEGFFIDGEHDFLHANYESKEAIKSQAKLIIWHDADMPPVMSAILDAFDNNTDYDLYRVIDTRMAYALRKQ